MDLEIQRLDEIDLDARTRRELLELLRVSFPDFYRDRIYYKQLPDFRFVARDAGSLVGQLGIDHRVISVGDVPCEILGIVDICVTPSHRGQGIAREMLAALETLARRRGVPFLVLCADDGRLYRRSGFSQPAGRGLWLGIEEHQMLGVIEKDLTGVLWVKELGERRWPGGEVQWLGHLF